MCHYKKGNQDDIIFVFSCPGKYEENLKNLRLVRQVKT